MIDAKQAALLYAMHTTRAPGIEMNTYGTANEKCRFCPAAEWCDTGRFEPTLENFMIYEPYPVEPGKRAA